MLTPAECAAIFMNMFRGEEGRIQSALARSGRLIRDEARSAIGTYKYGWPPLSPQTVARKGADTPLLTTGSFRGSINYTVKGHEVTVGSSDKRADWFENGTSRMPPRPVMRPALEAKRAEALKIIEQALVKPITG
jgi:HK97 gp10 family phage protein